MEGLRREMKQMEERLEQSKAERDDKLYGEMQEREVRKLNIIIHGVDEPPASVRVNRDRIEMDKNRCQDLFTTMRSRATKEDIRFCRRLGERGETARPLVVGLPTEELKRNVLFQAKNLQGTKFNDISVVPDLTKKQREVEDGMRREAEERNRRLSQADIEGGLKWIVVGRRGEKRLVKGFEREDARGGFRFSGTARAEGGRNETGHYLNNRQQTQPPSPLTQFMRLEPTGSQNMGQQNQQRWRADEWRNRQPREDDRAVSRSRTSDQHYVTLNSVPMPTGNANRSDTGEHETGRLIARENDQRKRRHQPEDDLDMEPERTRYRYRN